MLNRMMRPADQRDEKAVEGAIDMLKKPMRVLDEHLKGRDYLLGKDFTVADLNVAGVLILGQFVQLDLSATPLVQAWLDRCTQRPGAQKARSLK
jgi:glutathione S-transferase